MNNENLKPFKPGQSGNPAGMKKGTRHLTTIVREILDTEIEVEENGEREKKSLADVIARKLIKKAMEGDIRAIQEIFDRTEGKAVQKIDQVNQDTIKIRIIRKENVIESNRIE